MQVLIADCETDGLLSSMSRLWCIQLGDADTDEVTVYADQPGYPPLEEAVKRLKSADRVVFHNGQKFDLHVINTLYPDTLQPERIWDTLVAARLLDPEEKSNRLEDWGVRLKVLKGTYGGDFSRFDDELVAYARQDIVVNRALYKLLEPQLRDYQSAFSLESLTAYVIGLQELNGFCLNLEKACLLEGELRQEMTDYERELQDIFPPIWVQDGKRVTPPKTLNYKNPKRPSITAGAPYTRVKLQMFNPGSGTQIELRFRRKYNWKPHKFTPTGQAQVDEEVLSSLKFPEAKALLKYARVEKRLGQLADGKNGWLKLVNSETSRVYGAVNTMGASTYRMSHFKPNMAQVDKKDLRMREVWEARKGWKLVGIDADGLELRVLAHYLAPLDDGAFVFAVDQGKKEDGTDAHTINQKAVGLYKRESAKTFIYANIYGAGDPKLGQTVVDDAREEDKPRPKGSLAAIGKSARAALSNGMVGFNVLVDGVKTKAKKYGWVKAIDGRRIKIRSDHSAFNFLLQGGGAIVMKMALVIFHFERAPALGIVHGRDFGYCANVHDEAQIECKPELAETIGSTFADCIRGAGVRLGVRCPLKGNYAVGDNWKDTH